MTRFARRSIETAAPAAQPLLAATQRHFGFLPSPVARAANSPALLQHLLAGLQAFEASSLAPLEREVVAFTVAFEMECHYCMALHSAALASDPAQEGLVAALRAGEALTDPRLEALHGFVRSAVQNRGRASEAEWAALESAGFTEEQTLDAVLGVGAYLLSTLTNIVTAAELDPPFEAFRWRKPRGA